MATPSNHAAIIGPMKVNSVTHRTVLDIEKLDPAVRDKVLELEQVLYVHTGNIGKSALGIGKTLSELHAILDPLKLFTFYLNRLAWLPQTTAYRYMAAYKRLHQRLPEVIVEKAIASGMSLFSYSDKRPYGKYTEALDMMPAPPEDAKEAESWIYTLRLKAKELGQQPTRDVKDRVATMLARAYLKDPKGSVKEWLKSFEPLIAALVKKRR